jgi:hypothetical protein
MMPAHLLCGVGNCYALTDIEQYLSLVLSLFDFSDARYEHFFASQKYWFYDFETSLCNDGRLIDARKIYLRHCAFLTIKGGTLAGFTERWPGDKQVIPLGYHFSSYIFRLARNSLSYFSPPAEPSSVLSKLHLRMAVLSAKCGGGFAAITDRGMIIPPILHRVISKPEKIIPGLPKKVD